MNAKRIIAVLNECAANGTDAYGLAVAIAEACDAERAEAVDVLRAFVAAEDECTRSPSVGMGMYADAMARAIAIVERGP